MTQTIYPVGYVAPKPIKDVLREAINARRDELETSGFYYQDKLFQSDERSAARIANAALTASLLGGAFLVEWAAADNSTVQLDAAGMLSLQAAMTQHAAALHYRARTLKASVEAAATDSELAAIDINAGWPV